MKKCNICNTPADDSVSYCMNCGSSSFSQTTVSQESNNTQAQNEYGVPHQPVYDQPYTPPQSPTQVTDQSATCNGNIVAGIVGAFLFSLIGAALYFIIYQFGYIAGICGLVIFVLANFGYTLFSKGGKFSIAGLIVSIIMMIIMIFVAEYMSLSYEIFDEFKDMYDITFFDAVRSTPDFLADSDILGAVISDLGFAYLLGFIGTISNIINYCKTRKAAKNAEPENIIQ